MSEILKGNFNRQTRTPPRLPLSMLSGEQTAERFTRCDMFLRDRGAHQFYRTGRLSHDGGIQVGVFRQALQQVRITAAEKPVYEPWGALSRTEILQRAAGNAPLEIPQIEALRETGDIAVHIMDTLQGLQAALYPDIAKDIRTLEICTNAFATVLASIHGQPLNKAVL